MNRSHKIRLYPNNTQLKQLESSAGASRFAYNWGLARWKDYYRCGLKASSYQIKKDFIRLKPILFPWASEVGKSVYEQAFNDVGSAFKNFFRRLKSGEKPGYPKFKAKGRCRDNFYVANDRIRFFGNKVSIPKVGRVKMAERLRFDGKLLSATVSREADKWFMAFSVGLPDLPELPVKSCVGIDLGVASSFVCSDGTVFQNPKPLQRYERKLKRFQKSFSRMVQGSNRRKKMKTRIACLYQRIKNIRQDFLHKVTSLLCNENQVVAMEDLNVKGMVKNRHLANALMQQSFGEIRRMFSQKAQYLLKVDRFFPSSQLCSVCGNRQKMPLNVRTYECECGHEIDRDLNAAINIIRQALSEFTLVDKKALACLKRQVKLCLDEARIKQPHFSIV